VRKLLGRHLDAANIRWLVGGSVASSILGMPRATLAADLGMQDVVARLFTEAAQLET